MRRYLVHMPISHNGQRIPDEAVVDDVTAYGVRVKSPLPIARLLAGGRISPVAEPAPPSIQEPASVPAPVTATAFVPAEKRKKYQ